MQVLNFSVSNQILTAACPGRLVVAQARGHLFAQFALDQEWDGLSVTAVFSNDFARQSYQRILTSDPVEVPEEVLVAGRLFVSLVGLGDGGALRLTTKCMDKPIVVYRAGELVGLTLEETTPDLWEQVLASMGSLADLKTSDKSSLVAAINEILQSGGAGSVDLAAIAQAVEDYMAANPIQETDPTVPAWAKQPEKPTYTAEEVHALPDTVNPIVSADGNSQDGHLVVWDTDSSLVRDGGSFQDNLKQNIDSTLSKPGKAADAAAVGEELSSLSDEIAKIPGGGSGLTAAQIDLLEDTFEHIQWADEDGPQYAAQLITSLRGGESGGEQPEQPDTPKTLTGISAEYSGGNVPVGTELSSLSGITVTANYSDGTTATVTGYTLSGTISEGDNTITVTYMGKTATITVTGEAQSADDRTLLHNWILNDQADSNTDSVGGATATNYYAKKTADGWVINDTWLAIKFLHVFGANKTAEFDMTTSFVERETTNSTVVFCIGDGGWASGTLLQYNPSTDTWQWSASGQKTEIPELQGANALNGKTVAMCLSAEGALSLWLDGEYVSAAPGTTTSDSILVGNNANCYHDMTVSAARIYEGVM